MTGFIPPLSDAYSAAHEWAAVRFYGSWYGNQPERIALFNMVPLYPNQVEIDNLAAIKRAKERLDDVLEEFEDKPESVPYQIAAAYEIKEVKQALPLMPIPEADNRATIEMIKQVVALLSDELKALEKQRALEERHLRIMQDDDELLLILSMLPN